MATKMYVGDFLKKVKDLEEATDKYGVRLYDDMAIASFFGFRSDGQLKSEIQKARESYRTEMQENASKLKDGGMSTEEIAKIMGITTSTVEILLDADGKRRANAVKDLGKKQQELINKQFDDIQKALGWDNLFRCK